MVRDFTAIRNDLLSGKITCEQLVQHYLTECKNKSNLNAFISIDSEGAINRAKDIDKKLAEGKAGVLAGMVLGIKDNICIKGKRVTCASRILKDFESLYDATVIKRLEEADAIILGKTNMDEFAMGSSNENSAFGEVHNPLNFERVPGGSSGGSAAAVSAGLVTAALGSDTGGSVRQPASFCGIIGMKPTYGRVSRFGLVAFASSFDQIGVIGLSVYDIALIMKIISGYDPQDSTSANLPVPDYVSALSKSVNRLKLGLPKEYFTPTLDNEIQNAIYKKIDILQKAGNSVKEISLPHTEYTIATYYILTTAEASSNLARYDGVRYTMRSKSARDIKEIYIKSRSEGFGDEVKRRIMLGTYVLSAGYYDAYYRKAQKVRRLIKEDFDNAFKDVDCIITPTAPTTAFKIGEKIDNPLTMYLSDIYTVSANLAGIPAINIPCGKDSNNLPIGMQILGKQFDEETILAIADFLMREGVN